MTAFFHHLTYDFRTGLRDRSLMLLNYLFPIAFYGMMGLLMTGINPLFIQTMIPAMILVAIMSSDLLALPNPVVTAREAGVFRSFKINGVPALSIVTIPVLSSLLHTLAIAVLITATAHPLFKAALPQHWGWFVLVGLLAALSNAGLGMLIGVVSQNNRATVLWAQLIFLPSMMLGGLMLPTKMLSPVLFRVAMLLPTTHAMNAWSSLAMGLEPAFNPTLSLLVLLFGGLLSFGLAVYLFDWDSRNRHKGRSPMLGLLAVVPYLIAALLVG